MYKFLPILIFNYFIYANEITFVGIDEQKDGEINISLILDKVAYINSYSLEDPSRLVLEINDAHSKESIMRFITIPLNK